MREELMAVNSLHRSNAARKMLPRDDKFKKLPNSNSIDPGIMASYYNQQIDANSRAASFQVDPPDQDYMQLGSYWIEGFSGSTFCLPGPDPDPVQSASPAEKVKIFFSRKGQKTEEMEEFEQETRQVSSAVAQPAPAEYYQDQQVEDLEDIQEELPRERIEEKMQNRTRQEQHGLKTVEEHEDEHEEIEADMLTNYPPPSVLRQLPPRDKGSYSKTPGSFPETDEEESESETRGIARQIVQSSVDNVLDQFKAEKVWLQQLQELQRQEAAAPQDKGKGKARADDGNVSTTTIPAIRISSEDATDGGPEASSSAASSSTGRSRFRLGRLFNKRGATQGSTNSEASSSRETLSPVSTTGSEEAAAQEKLKNLHFPLLRFINKHRNATSDGGTETMECIACFTELPPRKLVPTPCKHLYCRDCFTHLITTSLDSNSEAQWPPKCCLTPIPIRTIVKYAASSRALFERYKAKEAEYKIPADQRIYCSTPNCGDWIPPTRRSIDKAAKTARCSKGHTMCVMCLGPPHKHSEICAEDRDLQLLDEIAEESGWRKCFKCQMLVEHAAACPHMTCRCGAQFCYICGLKWKTCACDSSELSRIKLRAEQNRLQREARDRGESSSTAAAADPEEAEWLANQLQLIEAMEMETEAGEQRRDEERRQEVARLEEVRRREAEEWARREEAVLRELAERYSRLRSELLGIENWQRTVLLNHQTRETDQCRSAAVRKRDAVKEKLERELLELKAETAAKIADREAEWKKEYAVRVAWERQLEEQYALLLRESYGENKLKAEAAMRSYMIKNDARRDAWRKTRDEELERFRVTAREDLECSEALIDALVRSAHRTADCELREIKRRHKAEFRWFELATAERNRLLAEMEAVERENGGEMPDTDDGTAASFRSWEIQDANYY